MTGVREWGIFARAFAPSTAPQLADLIAAAGYHATQLNLSALSFPTLPETSDWGGIDLAGIVADFEARGVRVWGLSGSYNMAHPDRDLRRVGREKALELVSRAGGAGIEHVTLCAGSRSKANMWEFHPENTSPEAYQDFARELDALVTVGLSSAVRLVIEPEHAIVVASATDVRRLWDSYGHNHQAIGFILDWANLVRAEDRAGHRAVLAGLIDAVEEAIVALHAKDCVSWDSTLAGLGVLDFSHLMEVARHRLPGRPVIVQDTTANNAAAVLRFLEEKSHSGHTA